MGPSYVLFTAAFLVPRIVNIVGVQLDRARKEGFLLNQTLGCFQEERFRHNNAHGENASVAG